MTYFLNKGANKCEIPIALHRKTLDPNVLPTSVHVTFAIGNGTVDPVSDVTDDDRKDNGQGRN